MAKLYGVSLGPGDPGLITRRAWEVLQQEDICWVYPVKKKNRPSYALQIAQQAGLNQPTQMIPLVFPMTHDKTILVKYWLIAANCVNDILSTGRSIAFLVEGDASTFSTFQHLVKTLKGLNPDIAVETIPGVPSFNAAAACAQRALVDTDDTLAVIPAGYGITMIETLLNDFDTLVLLKVKPLLDDIIDFLTRKSLLSNSCFIEKAGSIEQRIVDDITRLRGEKVNYLSLILITQNPYRQRGEVIRGCRKKS